MKQTALEWLYEEFTKTNYLTEDEFYMIFNQAKEMEEEQLILFGAQCMIEVEKESGLGSIRIYELYYNKTFNKSIKDKG